MTRRKKGTVTLTRDLQHQSFYTTDIQRATEAV